MLATLVLSGQVGDLLLAGDGVRLRLSLEKQRGSSNGRRGESRILGFGFARSSFPVCRSPANPARYRRVSMARRLLRPSSRILQGGEQSRGED